MNNDFSNDSGSLPASVAWLAVIAVAIGLLIALTVHPAPLLMLEGISGVVTGLLACALAAAAWWMWRAWR